MTPAPEPAPDDIAALRAALAAEQLARHEAEARASRAEAMVAYLKLLIAKLRHEQFGASSERGRKLLDHLELQLEKVQAAAAEDEAALGPETEDAPAQKATRRKPVRGPLPAHLPRERVVFPGPIACPCCNGRLSKLGEDVTETLEVVPRHWKVVQTVRERMACRACETVSQPPAPFHPIARGRAGPELLATILEAKFGQYLPLNRQSETFAREGIELDVSTMADWVGACTVTLAPLVALIRAHVLAAGRIHGDDTTVPVLARGTTSTGRLWTYVRNDRPFGGLAPPAAMFHYSPDRRGEHPQCHLAGYAGILQADAYAGFNDLYDPRRKPGPAISAGCWAHERRKLFDLGQFARAPLAAEAVRRIDAIFDAERNVNGLPTEQRLAVRKERIASLVNALETWMRATRGKMSRHADVGKAMDYMLKRWDTFSRFLGNGRICLTNNATERALRRGPRPPGLNVLWFRPRRRAGYGHILAHRHRQAERHRHARLARRRPAPDQQPPCVTLARTAALELEQARPGHRPSRLTHDHRSPHRMDTRQTRSLGHHHRCRPVLRHPDWQSRQRVVRLANGQSDIVAMALRPQ